MSKFLRVGMFLLVSFQLLAGNPSIDEGWKNFQNNKRPEAAESFKKALANSDAQVQAEAALGLAIVSWTVGKDDDAFRYFMDFYKKSDNPAPYAFALWNTNCLYGSSTYNAKEKNAFYQFMINDARSNGTVKAMVQRKMGYMLQSQGQFEKAKIEFNKQAFLNKWSIVGSFDNFSASGFNKDFKVLENPKQDAVFINKNNAEVKWFEVANVCNDGWLDFKYHLSWGNSVMYAQTFVSVDSDKEVYLRTGVSGAVKVWINDQLVLSDAQERNCDIDTYNNKIKLKKGFNRILLQISESDVNSANLLVRLTDESGTPIAIGEQSATFKDYTKVSGPMPELLPHFAEAYFKKRIESNPNSYVDHILLAMVYNRNERLFEARKTLINARKIAPTNGTVSRIFLDTYSSEDNNTQFTKEQEFIKANDPDNYYSLQLKFEEEFKKENNEEAEKIVNRMMELFGSDETIDLYKLRVVAEKNNQDETMRMVNALYTKYPNNYTFMSIKYSVVTSGNKDLASGQAILKKYAKKNFSDDVNTKMANNFFQLGNGEMGMKMYLDRPNKWPYSVSVYDDLAEIYMNLERYSDALMWQKKTLELKPYSGYYWNKMGEIYKAMNNTEEAKAHFKKAIYYDPTDFDSRKQLRELESKKDMFEYFPKVDVMELYNKAPKAEDYPEDNSIILLNETQKVVYPEGASEEKGELLVKIFKQQGIEFWKDYNVGSASNESLNIEKAEIIKANGQKVQAETNGSYIVFTSLEIGDAIHVLYRKERYSTGKLAKHFWDRFNMNYFFPSKTARYSLLVANNHTFKHIVLNSDMKPEIKDVEDYKLYTWELKDQASIKEEQYMPTLGDIGVVMEYSSIPDWNFVADWYSDISTTKTKADFEVKEAVEEVFKDKKNLDDIQKAKLIYEYIVKNINYNSVSFMQSGIVPQKAATTINYKLGDCKDMSTLFVAMAKEVGLNANVVLVDTRDNGEKDMVLPSIGFNHCIAQLNTGGKKYFIELTSNKLPFAAQSNSSLKSISLSIPQESGKGKYEVMQMPSNNRTKNQIIRQSEIKFSGDEMQMNKKTFKTGVFAESMRRDYSELGKENQEKDMLRAISSDYTTQVKLVGLTFKDLKSLSDTVEYDCKFTVQKSLVDFAGMKLFKLPWTEAFNFTEYFSLEKRKYDFNMWEMNDIEHAEETMTIEIPAGKALVEPPKVVKFSCKHADYSLSYTVNGNKLIVKRVMNYDKDIITPEEYNEAKEFFQKVSEYDSKQIGFK